MILNALDYLATVTLMAMLLTLPGIALGRLIRFRTESIIDRCLFTVGSSLALVALFGYYMSLLGVFTRTAVWGLLAGSLGTVLAFRACGALQIGCKARFAETLLRFRREVLHHKLDMAFLLLCTVYFLVLFTYAATTPITEWDAIISWDAWGMDWAERSSMKGYSFSYGQLVPIFYGSVYKLKQAFGEVPSIEMFVLHGLHPVMGFLCLLAVFRLARLCAIPFWPAGLLLVAHRGFDWATTSGYADVFLLFFIIGSSAKSVGELGLR